MRLVTLERFAQAFKEIEASGHRPTYVAIRDAVGGGSFSTISKSLKELGLPKPTKTIESPVASPPEMMKLLADLRTIIRLLSAEVKARAKLEMEKHRLTRQLKAEQAQNSALRRENEKLHQRLGCERARLADANKHREDLNAERVRLHTHNVQLLKNVHTIYDRLLQCLRS